MAAAVAGAVAAAAAQMMHRGGGFPTPKKPFKISDVPSRFQPERDWDNYLYNVEELLAKGEIKDGKGIEDTTKDLRKYVLPIITQANWCPHDHNLEEMLMRSREGEGIRTMEDKPYLIHLVIDSIRPYLEQPNGNPNLVHELYMSMLRDKSPEDVVGYLEKNEWCNQFGRIFSAYLVSERDNAERVRLEKTGEFSRIYSGILKLGSRVSSKLRQKYEARNLEIEEKTKPYEQLIERIDILLQRYSQQHPESSPLDKTIYHLVDTMGKALEIIGKYRGSFQEELANIARSHPYSQIKQKAANLLSS